MMAPDLEQFTANQYNAIQSEKLCRLISPEHSPIKPFPFHIPYTQLLHSDSKQ
jgi:hypothetical protein